VHFLGDTAAFVGAEESVFLVSGEGEISPVAAFCSSTAAATAR